MAKLAAQLLGMPLSLAWALSASAAPVITEIMYHPGSDRSADEFIELYNPDPSPVVLDDHCFDGVVLCFDPGVTIGAGQFLVLASDQADTAEFQALYGVAADHVYAGRLDDNGERLALLDGGQLVVDEVTFDDGGQWPVTADGLGPSIELIDLTQDNDTPRNWGSSTDPSGHTLGAPNSVEAVGLPPWIENPQHGVAVQPNTPIVVTATVLDATTVDLKYKIDFPCTPMDPVECGEVTLQMVDQGGDVWALPAGSEIPGQPAGALVRYRIEAAGGTGTMSLPRIDDTVRYTGTAVVDPAAVASNLPIFFWFMDDDDYQAAAAAALDRRCTVGGNVCTGGADCTGGSGDICNFADEIFPAVLFYDGTLYDGVSTRVRGGAARQWVKKPWKFIMPQGHNFLAPGLLERSADTFNLQSNYPDKSYLREILAWESHLEAGMPANRVFPVHVEQCLESTGCQFFGLYNYLEASDADWVERNGLDRNAARYKAFERLMPMPVEEIGQRYEKQSRKDEDHSDLVDLITSINTLGEPALTDWLYDNLDVPTVLNYLAVQCIIHDNDHLTKNYLLYRDTEGTQRWRVHGWDLDLTFGRNFNGVASLNDDIWADVDGISGLPADRSPSHPLFGTSERRSVGGAYNHLIDRVLLNPGLQQMYYRRLRSLMDLLLAEGRYEDRIDELAALVATEAEADRQLWGQFGQSQDQATAVAILKDDYLLPRRVHLFNTHAICGIGGAQPPAPPVVISEIMYDPQSGVDHEFIELYNPSATDAVDLSHWRLEGVALTVPPGTVVLPESFVIFVKNDVQFRAQYGGGKFVAAQFKGSLDDAGELLVLRNQFGAVISSVAYEAVSPWPIDAAGQGASLELVDVAQANANIANWAASIPAGGTPGEPNSRQETISAPLPLHVNEILPDNGAINTDEVGDPDPWVEIYNESAAPIDLGVEGLFLSDDLLVPNKWSFPATGVSEVGAGDHLLVWVDGEPSEATTHPHAGFLLPASGFIGLFDSSGQLIDYLNYGPLAQDRSLGRFPDGSALREEMLIVTAEAANQLPSSGLILNEYNAVADGEFLKNGNADTFWGCDGQTCVPVEGNGGDWFELFVAVDHLDIRNWELVATDDTGPNQTTHQISFGSDAVWADLRAGSIITVSDGLEDDFTYHPLAGDWWINVQWPSLEVSNFNWQLTIKDGSGNVTFGPAGEGVNPVTGIGIDEVFKLEEHPTAFITPLSDYNDGTSSTFGSPNVWAAGTLVQDFGPLRAIGLSGPCGGVDTDLDGFCDVQDNCPSVSNADQTNGDGDTQGDVCDVCPDDAANDSDSDGYCAGVGFMSPKLGDQDVCPMDPDPGQEDTDTGGGDGVGDACDNCVSEANANQSDMDLDGMGDVCDACPTDPVNDPDGDLVCDFEDNCPTMPNGPQTDGDEDGVGDVCDVCLDDADNDVDLDGRCAGVGFLAPKVGDQDNCPAVPNPSQTDTEPDGVGDLCDNCLGLANPRTDCDNDVGTPDEQCDTDGDGEGDACDDDDDGDGVLDGPDNCDLVANAPSDCDEMPGTPDEQCDTDVDGVGDVCDGDDDEDMVLDEVDNCPLVANNGQQDMDLDGYGDACDCQDSNPSVGSKPHQVGDSLRFDDDTTLSWIRGPQGFLTHVYRGDFTTAGAWAYNETCLAPNLAQTQTTDGSVPAAGSGYYYLAAGYNVCGEGPASDPTTGNDHYAATPCAGGGADWDSDTVADVMDNCAVDANLDQMDDDDDFVGNACDNCDLASNPLQQDLDGDGEGDACDDDDDGDGVPDVSDDCPRAADPQQLDSDGDGAGDQCDPCTDLDGDGLGDGTMPANVCAHDPFPLDPDNDADADGVGGGLDNCVETANPDQADQDQDGAGDACDPCPDDPDDDADADGICAGSCGIVDTTATLTHVDESVLVEIDSSMRYLANDSEPASNDLGWTLASFNDQVSPWSDGVFGVGYEAGAGAEGLLRTMVPVGTRSVYSRATFDIAVVGDVRDVFLGVDYDDGVIAWINGIEVYRSPEMPSGDPGWDAIPTAHESSNFSQPDHAPLVDITATAKDALVPGTNLLAIGVWNTVPAQPPSDDLVLVPRLSINRGPTMLYLANGGPPSGFAGVDWVAEDFDDSAWTPGAYGVGYEDGAGAEDLLSTTVDPPTVSIYTRAGFFLEDASDVRRTLFGADYDDGVKAWINGVEIYSSPGMPSTDPEWNTNSFSHESSNGTAPDFSPWIEISDLAMSVLQDGINMLAVGVWNNNPSSSDLVLWPELMISTAFADNCPSFYNPEQLDGDLDGAGDGCDNCPGDFNAQQSDPDGDGLGTACDNCPEAFNDDQTDSDGDGVGEACDNCPGLSNATQADSDGDGIGDPCDTPQPVEIEPNDLCAQGNPVTLGDVVLASLQPFDDYDYFRLTLGSDTALEIETVGDPTGDTVVAVFGFDGTPMIGCDDDKPVLSDQFSLFFCCLPPGDYCVGVKAFDPNGALSPDPEAIGSYSIEFSFAGACAADPDPMNNGCPTADDPALVGACEPW